MKKERAIEIVHQIYNLRFQWDSSEETINKIISYEERKEIKEKWYSMPGYTCFADALHRLAKGE